MKVHELMTKKITALWPWIIWLLSALFYFYENLLQVSPSVLVDELTQAFSVNAAALGYISAAYFYAYAAMQIPVGVLVDKYSVRVLLTMAVITCALGCVIFAFSSNVTTASIGRLLMGFGSAFAAVCNMKLAANWFSPDRFPFFVGLMVTVGFSGSMVGETPLAHLVDFIGWRQSMLLLAGVGFVLAIIIVAIVQTRPHGRHEEVKHQQLPLLEGLKHVVAVSQSWILALYGGLMFASTSIFGGLWGVPFIQSAYHLNKPVAAGIVSLLFLGWVVGSPSTGWLASRARSRKQVMWVGTLGALLCMALILYLSMPLFLLSFIVFAFGVCSSCFLPSFTFIKELHPVYYTGAALGFMNMANMLGGALGQPLVGYLLDLCWQGDIIATQKTYTLANYQLALSVLPAFILLSLILLFFIKEKPIKRSA